MEQTLRPSGLPFLGDLPWGSHICQFYRSASELLELLVPWFKAGLENNEYCVWVTARQISCQEAEAALRIVCRDFDTRLACGQILIVSGEQWYRPGGRFDTKQVLDNWFARIPIATGRGFDGLRVSADASWLERDEWREFTAYETYSDTVVSGGKFLVLCTYPIATCGAAETLDAMKNHAFAMIRRDGAWEVIENQARRRALETVRELQHKYDALTGHMDRGFAYHQMICNSAGEPVDCLFLDVNAAFERILGLARETIVGKRMSEVLPEMAADPEFIRRYGQVAMTGQAARYEEFARPMGKWLAVSAFSTERGYFAVTLQEITAPATSANERE
jgi:PAS domain S-box-containing protein